MKALADANEQESRYNPVKHLDMLRFLTGFMLTVRKPDSYMVGAREVVGVWMHTSAKSGTSPVRGVL